MTPYNEMENWPGLISPFYNKYTNLSKRKKTKKMIKKQKKKKILMLSLLK